MKPRPVFAHIRKTRNLGDLACCPADGFSEFDDCKRICWTDWQSVAPGVPIIFGGGGLFMPGCSWVFREAAKYHPVAIWGAGLNYPNYETYRAERAQLVSDLKCCGLVGIRNPEFAADSGFDFVPCASALSTFFPRASDHAGVVAYEHSDARFAGPRLRAKTNCGDSLFEAIQFIASARVVITNSYHGAYWASLCGARPLLWNPQHFGNRFDDWFDSSSPARVTNRKEAFEMARGFVAGAPLLEVAQLINIKFYGKILAWLDAL